MALPLFALALGLVALAAVRARRRIPPRTTAVLLAALQCGGFALLETVERGSAFADAWSDPAVLVGCLLQAPVAFCLVRLLAVFASGIWLVCVRLGPDEPAEAAPTAALAPSDHGLRLHGRRLLGGVGSRAPPDPAAV